MTSIPNPVSPHDERFDPWVRAIALTAAATVLAENTSRTDHYRPTSSAVAAETLTLAIHFAHYIKTGTRS